MINRRIFINHGVTTVATLALASNAEASSPKVSSISGYDYRLPQFEKGSRLLFQGDSITDMKWGRNQTDRNHYLGHSYVYLIAARLGVDMPQAQLEFFNRGISGNKVGDLRKRWREDAIEMKPDWLSILIGINDVEKTVTKENGFDLWEDNYRFILDESLKANPELKLVLLNPFVLASGRLANLNAFKAKREIVDRLCMIVSQLAFDYNAVHVKTDEIFDKAARKVNAQQWIWDGIHPLPQGHELIARNWLQAVSKATNTK
ncbi:MAG: SGNH/GDSL hydrolase family protein [Opitutae bacterium]